MPTIILQREYVEQLSICEYHPRLHKRSTETVFPSTSASLISPIYYTTIINIFLFIMACQRLGQTNAFKRSRSSFENVLSEQVKFDIPFDHYAIIYTDEDGGVIVDSSPSLRDEISFVIPTEARRKFLMTLGQIFGFQEPDTCCMVRLCKTADNLANTSRTARSRTKRHKCNIPASVNNYCAADTSETPISTSEDFSSCDDKKMSIPIGDTKGVICYYKSALQHFQQLNCRVIAKAFIKFIEPHKRANHPYRGRKTTDGSNGDPEKTKPEWWPPHIMHKEPDHMRKEGMLLLIISD